jgi:serine/threonine-protein kinase
MTMDFIAGTSLRKRAQGPGLAIEHAVQVALQLLSGLEAMHTVGVLHRDLKSDNVMISGTDAAPHAVLIDFGLSRSLGKSGRVAGAPMSGSMGYMAPEQIDGKELSPQTDIFAFGVVLFELLTGALPFDRRGPHALGVTKQWSAAAPSTFRAEVPPALDEVVGRCLRYSPGERYPDASSVARALDRFGSRRSA